MSNLSWLDGPRHDSPTVDRETIKGAGIGCRGCIKEGRRESTGVSTVGGALEGECADCGERGFKLDWQHTCQGKKQCPECRGKSVDG